ncbi:nuclear transport factor 2 family protein [Frateuria sp.]|uniref:nuclear transport factor 2 family protein n=1 Tax=Frateuria sp. TaxID=2211372 RepID=UPI00184164E9|nr:nuclear transport factor 2 family protein [Frateuria sp.]NUR22668.1 SnoaL-like domain-containing protein [Frateuria sp.]
MKPCLAIAMLLTLAPLHAIAACGSTGAHSSPPEVVQAQVDAYNAHDVEALAACYADDASLVYLAGERPPIRGRDAIRMAFGFLPRQPKAFHVEVVRRSAAGPVVVDLERLHGLAPDKHLPDAFAIYEVRAGLIAKAWFPPAK